MKNILKQYIKTRDLLEAKIEETEEQLYVIKCEFLEEYFEVLNEKLKKYNYEIVMGSACISLYNNDEEVLYYSGIDSEVIKHIKKLEKDFKLMKIYYYINLSNDKE